MSREKNIVRYLKNAFHETLSPILLQESGQIPTASPYENHYILQGTSIFVIAWKLVSDLRALRMNSLLSTGCGNAWKRLICEPCTGIDSFQ